MISDLIRRWFGFTGFNPFSKWQVIRDQEIDLRLEVEGAVLARWKGMFVVEHHLDKGVRAYVEDRCGRLRRIDDRDKITEMCKDLQQKCSCGDEFE